MKLCFFGEGEGLEEFKMVPYELLHTAIHSMEIWDWDSSMSVQDLAGGDHQLGPGPTSQSLLVSPGLISGVCLLSPGQIEEQNW